MFSLNSKTRDIAEEGIEDVAIGKNVEIRIYCSFLVSWGYELSYHFQFSLLTVDYAES